LENGAQSRGSDIFAEEIFAVASGYFPIASRTMVIRHLTLPAQ
jgi:hypothetical protein